ncbi:WYL domain-containing protein [Hymenobacter sp.]|uniref:helix-turn-helix transcriptional regulator n=1 Tax=Hymenobacter sp. TaxID=1898978 RepID=UPI002ED899C6
MDKLRAVLRRADRDYVADVAPHVAVQSRHAPPAPDVAAAHDPDTRQQLLASLASRQVVRLAYCSGYGQTNSQRDIEPIGLYFNLHWHVVAYCRLRQELRDFRLDRIEQLHLLPEPFAPRSETLASYWAEQRAQSPPQAVVLRFSSRGRQLVRDEKYFYGWVAEQELPDGAVEMQLLLPALRYLAHWLLYFGAEATVVSPPALRELVVELARQALAHHAAPNGAGAPAAGATEWLSPSP